MFNTFSNLRPLLITVAIAVLPALQAVAATYQSESVEWWVNIADGIVLARVSSVEPPVRFSKERFDQKVHFEQLEALSGDVPAILELTHYFAPGIREGNVPIKRGPAQMLIGDLVLLFYGRRHAGHEGPVGFYTNLTRPDMYPHTAAYDNQCRQLTNVDTILSLVRNRIRLGHTRKLRGLIVPFTGQGRTIDVWSFVVTAEPEFKAKLITDLSSAKQEARRNAILELASYPGQETVRLVRPLLNDSTISVVESTGSSGKEKYHIWYPVRQAAFVVLTNLGERVKRPPKCPEEMDNLCFSYLDVPGIFPSGKWRRFFLGR